MSVEEMITKADESIKNNNQRKKLIDNFRGSSKFYLLKEPTLSDSCADGVVQSFANLVFEEIIENFGEIISSHDSIEQLIDNLIKTFPVTKYYQAIRELSEDMNKSSSTVKPGTDMDFWLAAEENVRAVFTGILMNQDSIDDKLKSLTRAGQMLSSEVILEKIRKKAYFLWKESKQDKEPIYYWLTAEKKFLQEARTGNLFKKYDK